MLDAIFYWVFNMSISAAVIGLVVLMLRRIRKLPRRIAVLLWGIPFFRLLCPLGVNTPYSLMSLISRFTTRNVVVLRTKGSMEVSVTNSVMAIDDYSTMKYKSNALEKVFQVSSIIWLIVAVAILLTLTFLYVSTMKELKDSTLLYENVYQSEKVVSPAVYGIIKPRIIIPAAYADTDITYVLKHERAHISRKDNLWRMMAFVIVAVHWFNPLAWVFLNMLLSDIELACDDKVLAGMEEDKAKEYARSLLECKEATNLFASAFGVPR